MTANRTLRAVAFDLDGLIANTEDLYELAGEALLGRRGKTYDLALREQMMGRPAIDALQIMIDCHALTDPLHDLMGECEEVLAVLMATSLAAMPGLHTLVAELSAAEIPIVVATSSTRDYADSVLSRLAIKNHFQFALTADDIRRGKPDPEIYQLTATRLQLAPSEMMVLEDSANGCRAAVAAGAFAVAVPNRHTQHHDFAGAKFVAETLADPRIRRVLGIG